MSITAVVVNYNTGGLLGRCVGALLDSTAQPSIRVVDNASSDGSPEELQERHGDSPRIRITVNDENLGFARAVNACLPDLESDYLAVVNPDCEVEEETLDLLRAALEGDPAAAIAGPMVFDQRGQPEAASMRHFPDPLKSFMTVTGLRRLERRFPFCTGVPVDTGPFLPGPPRPAEAVSGACMLIRRSALERVGPFDEGYGLHCEDLDLMYRLREAGWHCLFVPAARALHHQGVSSRSRPFWVHRQKHRGMARFFYKFQADRYSGPVRWLVVAGIWLRYLLLIPRVAVRR